MKYPAAERITWLEWLIFGLILAGFAIAVGVIAGSAVVWLIHALRG